MTEETINEIQWTIHQTNPELVQPARASLSEVIDPEIGMHIIQLGLVRDISVKNGVGHVKMILTTPFCPYGPAMMTLAHPAVVDTIPTSANQEDHVSMATFADRKAGDIARNAANVIAIELLAAAQGLDFHAPLKTSRALQQALAKVRGVSANMERDRSLAGDIARVCGLIESGAFAG